MKKYFKKIIPPKKFYLGLDIGASEIKAVEIKKVKAGYRVSKTGSVATPEEAVEDGKIVNIEALSGAIKELVFKHNLQTKEVFIVVNGTSVITRQVPMPVMDDKELTQALKYEAERYIPIPIEDLILDHLILDREETIDGPQYNLLLVAVPQQLIYEYYDLLVSVGLTPVAVEIVPCSMWRLFSTFGPKGWEDRDDDYILIDIGTSITNVMIFSKGKLVFNRSIPIGGYQITDSIAQTFMLSVEDAESYKISDAQIILEDNPEDVTSEPSLIQMDLALRTGLSGLLNEIQQSLDFYKLNQKSSESFEDEELMKKIFLLGATAKISGLNEFFEAELGLSVEKFDNSFFVNRPNIFLKKYMEVEFATKYSIALGLALREVVE